MPAQKLQKPLLLFVPLCKVRRNTLLRKRLLILVHDLVKLLFEFVHHCNLTFLKFFIFNAGRRQTKMKKREQLFFVANSSTKVILALCEASPSGEKMPAMHRPDGQRHCRHKVQK